MTALADIEHWIKRLDADYDTAALAAATLVRIGDDAVDPLRQVLDHPREHVRVRAAEALGAIGNSGVVDDLVRAMGCPHLTLTANNAPICPHQRPGDPITADCNIPAGIACVRALGAIGGDAAVLAVCALLCSAESHLRDAAAKVLRSLGWRGATVSDRAVHALVLNDLVLLKSEGPAVVAPLCELLRAPVPHLRVSAAVALGHLGYREALPELNRRLRFFFLEGDPDVRRALAAARRQIEASTSHTGRLPRAETPVPEAHQRPRTGDAAPDPDARPRSD